MLSGPGLVDLDDDTVIGQRQQPDGTWAVSTAPTQDGPWTRLVDRGCNFIAAGGGNWVASDGALFGPAAVAGAGLPAGQDGRGNASPDGTILLVANPETGQGLILKRRDDSALVLPGFFPTDRACVVDRDRALWVDARDGLVHTCGTLPVPLTVPGPVYWPSVFWVPALAQWWIAYHSRDDVGYICHPFDNLEGYRLTLPPAFYPCAMLLEGTVARFVWALDPKEAQVRTIDVDLTSPRVLLDVPPPLPPPPPPPAEEIGPRSDPLPNGTWIEDLLLYVLSDPSLQPRIGPSHSMGQKIRGQWWDKVKFAFNEPALRTGKSYETWCYNDHWIMQHSDATAFDPYQQTDWRMWARRMQIGERYAFKTPPHEIVWKHRPGDPGVAASVAADPPAFALAAAMQVYRFGSSMLRALARIVRALFAPCQETQRQPWGRKMWIEAVWPKFYCGPDLGIREVAMLVYDATAGIREPGRYIEAAWCALDAGDIRWEPHKAWLMYLKSSSKAVFDDTTRADRKDFYLIGGPDPDAQRLGCFPEVIPTTPEYGPWEPNPKPPPPPIQTTPYPAATAFRKGAMSKVTLFEHIDYQGRSWAYDADSPFVGDGNDQFSSAKVAPGVSVILFEHANYGGRSVTITGDVPDFRPLAGGWNDVASSLKVTGSNEAGIIRLTQRGQFVECNAGGTIALTGTKSDNGKVAVTHHDDKRYDALFIAANKTLSIQNDGSLQSRPAGTYGPFEQIRAATQPEPADVHVLFRSVDGVILGGTVLQIVEDL